MFELNGKEYSIDQIKAAANESGLNLDDYIAKAGLKKKEETVAKSPGTDKGVAVQEGKAPVTESNSVKPSSGSLGDQVKEKSPRRGVRENEDGSVSTHKMSYAEADGKYIAYPTLFQNEDGSWFEPDTKKNKWAALDEAEKRGETYTFDTEEEAKAFATDGNWKNKDIETKPKTKKKDDFYLYQGRKYKKVELQALSQVQDVSSSDAFVLTTPQGENSYSYNEIKEAADKANMSVKTYLGRFKNNPKYGVSIVPGGLDIQQGIELNPIVLEGDITGRAAELAPKAKNLKRELQKVPTEQKEAFLELKFRDFNKEDRAIVSELIKEPTEFKTASEASTYIKAKAKNIEFINEVLEKEVNNVEVKSFLETSESKLKNIKELAAKYESAEGADKDAIAKELRSNISIYKEYVRDNEYAVSKIDNLKELRNGLNEMVPELQSKISEYGDNAEIEEAVSKSYALLDKAALSIDTGVTGITSALSIPIVAMFDEDMAKAEAVYQGDRLAKAREDIVSDLTFDQAKDNGRLYRYATEALASESFSALASVLAYSGPQGLAIGLATFGLSSGGGKYIDLMNQRAKASAEIESLENIYDQVDDPKKRDEIASRIKNLETVRNFSDSDITRAALLSGSIEAGVTLAATKFGSKVLPRILKKSPKIDKFLTFKDKHGIIEKAGGILVGEQIEEHSISLLDGYVHDGLILGLDVDIDDVVNIDSAVRILLSSGGTSAVGSVGRVAGAFVNMAKNTRQRLEHRKDLNRLIEIKNEMNKISEQQDNDELDFQQALELKSKITSEAEVILEKITRDNENAALTIASLDDKQIKKLFKNKVKQRKLAIEAARTAAIAQHQDRKVGDGANYSHMQDLQNEFDKLDQENDKILYSYGDEIDTGSGEFAKKGEISPKHRYIYDFYRANVKLAKAKSTVLELGQDPAEKGLIIKLYNKLRDGDRIEDIDAYLFKKAVMNNPAFQNLSAKNRNDILKSLISRDKNGDFHVIRDWVTSSGSNTTYGDGNFQVLNNVVSTRQILDPRYSDIEKLTTVSTPMHEMLHSFHDRKGLKLEDVEKAGKELLNELEQRSESGEVSKEVYRHTKATLDKSYLEDDGTKGNKYWEEVINRYYDLWNSGVIDDKSISSKPMLAKAINNLKKQFAGMLGGAMSDSSEPGFDIKAYLTTFREFQVNKSGFLINEGGIENSGKGYVGTDASYESKRQKLEDQWSSGAIDDDTFYNRLEQLENEIEAGPKTKKVKEDEEVDSTEKKPKAKRKRSKEAQAAKEELDAIGNDPNGYDPNSHFEAIERNISKMVEAQARNWRTEDNRYVNLERELVGFDMEDVQAETFYDLMKGHIPNFDPEKNDSLYGWINRVLRRRMQGVLKKYLTPSVPSIQAEQVRNLEAQEEYNAAEMPQINLIDPSKIFSNEDSKALDEKLRDVIDELEIKFTNFKNVENWAVEYISKYFGIKGDKVTDLKKNLSTDEMRDAQRFIYHNRKLFMKMLPKGAVVEAASEWLIGTSTGVPKNLLKVFYRMDEKRRTEAQGLWAYKLRNDITESEFLEAFAINPDGTPMSDVFPRDKIKGKEHLGSPGQTIKTFSNMYGKLVTNTKVRQLLVEKGVNPNKIQDIAAGRANSMLSKSSDDAKIDAAMESKINEIAMNDMDLETIVESTLSKAGFSKIDILKTINRMKRELNNGKRKFVGLAKDQTVIDYINDTMFELISDDAGIRQVAGVVGSDIRMNGTELGSEMKKSVAPKIVAAMVKEMGIDPTEAVIQLAKMFERSFSSSSKFSWFQNNNDLVDYLNKMYANYLKDSDGKSTGSFDIKNGSLVFERASKLIVNIGGKKPINSKTAKKHGLDDLVKYKDFTKIESERLAEEAMFAKRHLKTMVMALGHIRGELSNQQAAALVASLIGDKSGVLSRASHTGAIIVEEGLSVDDYVFEPRPPVSYFARMLTAFLVDDKQITMDDLTSTISSMSGIWIPKKMQEAAKKFKSKTMGGRYMPGGSLKYDNYIDLLESDSKYDNYKITFSKSELGLDNDTNDDNSKVETGRSSGKSQEQLLGNRSEQERGVLEDRMSAILANQDERVSPASEIDKATASNMARDRKKSFHLMGASADDFEGLLYRFLGKGKLGDDQKKFFYEKLIKPYNRAMFRLNAARQLTSFRFRTTSKEFRDVTKKLKQKTDDKGFTFDEAIRVYLYNKAGHELKDLNTETKNHLIGIVVRDPRLKAYAAAMSSAMNIGEYWVDPDTNWRASTIKGDIIKSIESTSRKMFMQEWVDNKNQIFSDNNMNKIEAIHGPKFRQNLNTMLLRMQTGRARTDNTNDSVQSAIDWFRGSVATTMFLNQRSAVLQLISFANFVNYTDNHPFKALSVIAANPNEAAKTMMSILQSDFLKERRGGLKNDFEAADLARAIKDDGGMKGAINFLLKKGFVLTQAGDSLAIAIGGTSFYMNRKRTYLNDGMTDAQASRQAFLDFQETAEKSQQSARQDRLSNQQTDTIGRILLAFQNTPMQYTRIMYKAALDLKNGRGNPKEHIGKILYYGVLQNLMFSMLQNLADMWIFDDEDLDEEERKKNDSTNTRVLNNMSDTLIRGFGMYGAITSAVKNAFIRYFHEQDKGWKADNAYVLLELINVSPAIGIKARKAYGVLQNDKFNSKIYKEMGWDNIDNPVYDAIGDSANIIFNLPVNRAIAKYRNVSSAITTDMENWQRIALLLGWSKWNVGVDDSGVQEARDAVTKRRREEKKAATRAKKEAANPSMKKGRSIKGSSNKQSIKKSKD